VGSSESRGNAETTRSKNSEVNCQRPSFIRRRQRISRKKTNWRGAGNRIQQAAEDGRLRETAEKVLPSENAAWSCWKWRNEKDEWLLTSAGKENNTGKGINL